MAHDVFISHASEDKAIADAVCATLEGQGVRCWIAPRDIRPGDDWGECIIEGIKHARVFVLVFSHQANSSPHIPREVERAVSHGIPIIPLRTEHVLPEGSLEYNLATVHWLDAMTPPVEAHIKRLADTVHAILGAPSLERSEAKQETRHRTDPWPPVAPPARPKMLIPAAIGLTIVAVLGTYLYFNRQPVQVTTPNTSLSRPAASPTPARPTGTAPRPQANPPDANPPPAYVIPPTSPRRPSAVTPDSLRADMKSRALAQPRWFQCSLDSCTFGGVQSFGPAIRRVEFGENSGKLDRFIDVPGWDAPLDPRQQGVDRWRLDNIPIRPGSGELYVRLVFYDGSSSDVRPAIMQPNRDHVAGVRIEPLAFSFGPLPELSLFAGFTPGRNNGLVFKPEAPVQATAAFYWIDDGPFRPARALDHGTTTDIGFEFETPVEDATIHVRFTMPDGSQVGPIGYSLKNAAAIPLSAFKERLSLELDQVIACARIPFTLPLPDASTGSAAERQANARDAAQFHVLLIQRSLTFVTTAPTVACVPERAQFADLYDWAAVKEVHTGTQSGKLDQVQSVHVDFKDALGRHVDTQNRWRVWQVQLPVSTPAVFLQFVFYDGSRSKEFSVGIETLRLPGRTP